MFFYNNWVEMTTGKDYTDKEVEYVFNKTMTVNEKELIENCVNSLEILSLDTILSKHPYVNDKEDEKEKIRIKEDENSDIKWVDIDKAIELTSEEKMRAIYEKYNKKIRVS